MALPTSSRPDLNADALLAENEQLRLRLAEVEHASSALAERMRELVSDSEARFAAIFRDAAVGILLVDPQGRIVMANPAACRILGFKQGELRGTRAFELWPEATPFQDLMQGRRKRYQLERQHRRPDGLVVWTSLTVTVIHDVRGVPEYALALIEDVTERREAEHSARQLISEQAARAEAEAARRRIGFLAEASVALSSSLELPTTLECLARLTVPVLGDFCLIDVVQPDATVLRVAEAAADPDLEQLLRQIPRVAETQARSDPVVQVLKTGKTRLLTRIDAQPLASDDALTLDRVGEGAQPYALLIVPVQKSGNVLGAITLGGTQKERAYVEADISMAEELSRRAALAIENAHLYRDAREASRLKDDFLAVVSHELRTPLMPILGWSQLLRDGKVPRATLEAGLEAIERNARSQARLIDDLLDVSRIVAGMLRIEPRPMSLALTIEEAMETVRPAAKAKGIRLTAELDPQTPRVMGDPSRLLQVIWNLLNNAIKFTPQGGLVELRLVPGRPGVLLEVSDSGEGIQADFLPHVFDRFRQGESASTRRHGGLGLGLSIVRHLVELHGGTVSAASSGTGRGAVFTVVLPAAPTSQRTPEPPAPAAPRSPNASRIEGVSLLVVDDQPDTLALLGRILREYGAQVATVESAGEALEALSARRFDLLISDLGMPGEDGFALIAKVRALPSEDVRGIPAIAVTAFAHANDRVRALEAGFQSHVAKPVDPAELVAVVASLVQPPPRTSRRRGSAGAGARRSPGARPRKSKPR